MARLLRLSRAACTLVELREYASLLGDEQAEELTREQKRTFASMAAAPATSKSAVQEAFRRHRGTKDFNH